MGRIEVEIDRIKIDKAIRWSKNYHDTPDKDFNHSMLELESWNTDQFKDACCIAQQLYAERMGWV